MPRLPRPLAALLVPLLLLGAGCSSLQGTGDLEYVAGGTIREIAPAERGEPVELSGTSTAGDPVDVADWRGQVVVVNVWWSGCGPCRAEMPLLAEADAELDDVEFVGINIRDTSAEAALAFERGRGVDYPSIYSDDGTALLAFAGEVAPTAMPSTVVLDAEGRVAAVVNGEIPSEITLRDLVEAAQDGGGDARG